MHRRSSVRPDCEAIRKLISQHPNGLSGNAIFRNAGYESGLRILTAWETNMSWPTEKSLKKLAEILNVDVAQIIAHDIEPPCGDN